MEKPPSSNKVHRREFMLGAGVTLLSSNKVLANAPETSPRPEARPSPELTLDKYMPFLEQAMVHTRLYISDLNLIVKRAESINGLPVDSPEETALFGTVFSQVREAFPDSTLPTEIAEELKELLPFQAVTESLLDLEAESNKGAIGLLQLKPEVIKEHGEDIADPLSIEGQVVIAERLLTQAYRYLTQKIPDQLAWIETNLFAGDQSKFNKFFMVPVLLSAYHAGMGNVAEAIEKFLTKWQENEDLHRLKNIANFSPYDYYQFIATAVTAEEMVASFGTASEAYVAKIIAVRAVLQASLQEERYAQLIYGSSPVAADDTQVN